MGISKYRIKIVLASVVFLIYTAALVEKEDRWVINSNKSITALNNFITANRQIIIKDNSAASLTVPAKVDDIPVFQLGFDRLFNFSDSLTVITGKNGIQINQKDDNYFILFNNEKNVKFDNKKLIFNSVTIPCQEVKNKILYTFSNGEFYKLRGIE